MPGFFHFMNTLCSKCLIITTDSELHRGRKINIMENLKEIVKGTMAKLVHVCNGVVVYQIQTAKHLYQLEIDSKIKEWESTYLLPEFKSITLMRWIRKGIDKQDDSFILLK